MTFLRALFAAMILAAPAMAQPIIIPLQKQHPPEPAPNPSPVPVAPPQSQPSVSGPATETGSTPAPPNADQPSNEDGSAPARTGQPSR